MGRSSGQSSTNAKNWRSDSTVPRGGQPKRRDLDRRQRPIGDDLSALDPVWCLDPVTPHLPSISRSIWSKHSHASAKRIQDVDLLALIIEDDFTESSVLSSNSV